MSLISNLFFFQFIFTPLILLFTHNYNYNSFCMKKKNLIVLLLAVVAVFSLKTSFAQNTTFKLSDYKNPRYLYQSLDLNFGLNSSLNVDNNKSFTNSSNNAFSLNSQAGAVYNRYANSPDAQGDLLISFDGGISSGSTTSDYSVNADSYEGKTRSLNHNADFYIRGLHRFYNQKQNFVEINGSLSVYNLNNSGSEKSYASGTITAAQETKKEHFQNSIQGSVLVGKGRIEQVQNARLALYLLDDLFTLNREKRSVSDQDVNDLAQLLTNLKYKRFFDSRLRHIAEITAIDSFMQSKGIVNTADAVYFTSLNDNWAYANNPIRSSGHRYFTGLEANFGYTRNTNNLEKTIPENLTNETTARLKSGGLYWVVGLAYEKPTCLKWQNSANMRAGVGIRQYAHNSVAKIDPNPENESNQYMEATPSIFLNADYGFGYYPTSRTWLTCNWWLSTGWEKQKQGDTKAEKADFRNNFNLFSGPRLQAYYYLSEKLRLSFSFQGQFNLDKNKYTMDLLEDSIEKTTRTGWNQSLSAALTYSLF